MGTNWDKWCTNTFHILKTDFSSVAIPEDTLQDILVSIYNNENKKPCLFLIDDDGNSLLHIAAENGLSKVVSDLLDYGLSADYKNSSNQTALDLAESEKSKSESLPSEIGSDNSIYEDSQSNVSEDTISSGLDAVIKRLEQAALDSSIGTVEEMTSIDDLSVISPEEETGSEEEEIVDFATLKDQYNREQVEKIIELEMSFDTDKRKTKGQDPNGSLDLIEIEKDAILGKTSPEAFLKKWCDEVREKPDLTAFVNTLNTNIQKYPMGTVESPHSKRSTSAVGDKRSRSGGSDVDKTPVQTPGTTGSPKISGSVTRSTKARRTP